MATPTTTTSSLTTSLTSSLTTSLSTTLATSISKTLSSTASKTATSESASASPTGAPQAGPTSKPLLFFVALGFGVVFTNLWIIVGVKYCFRYNQRARHAAIDAETGEPIDLNNMARPRRRREKKLMTIEEVNERFPLTKYKVWRATREHEGLPAAGGITAPASRAASIKEAVGLDRVPTTDDSPTEAGTQENNTAVRDFTQSDEPVSPTDTTGIPTEVKEKLPNDTGRKSGDTRPSAEASTTAAADTAMEEDDDDPIRTAVPTELLAEPGDSCAICLESLDDDDEIRGLTCGHAFHSSCLDPWLTTRRACCPLCKADYYIPKPRPEGETTPPEATRRTPVVVPAHVFLSGRAGPAFRPRLVSAGTTFRVERDPRYGFPVLVRERPTRQEIERQRQRDRERRRSSAALSAAETRASVRLHGVDQMNNFLRMPLRILPRWGGRRGTSENQQSNAAQLEEGRS